MMKGSRKKKQNQLYSMSKKLLPAKVGKCQCQRWPSNKQMVMVLNAQKVKGKNSVRQKTIKGGKKRNKISLCSVAKKLLLVIIAGDHTWQQLDKQ